ncbi:MAG: MFS transporter [Chloroflexi bacterium]|nr:MFS transporter [Chloroflexota bacterium]
MARTRTDGAAIVHPAHDLVVGGVFSALHTPGYPLLWTSGWLWNLSRWMAVFLGSYLVNQRTGSPLLVQLTGAAFYTPILLGGALGGVISDRFDRRRSLMAQLALLIPVAVLMGALTLSGHLSVWMVYPFMVVVGIGWVVDMTSRRALVFDMVGPDRVTNAMALEAMSMTGGAMLGNLLGGAVISFVGIGQTFLAMALVHAIAWRCLVGLPETPRGHVPVSGSSVGADLLAGLRYVRGQRLLLGILGVTVLVNLFYYPYQPLVPVFAGRLHVDAFWAGLLAASAGVGSLTSAWLIASRRRPRRGRTYLGGSGLAMLGVAVFAASRWYPLSTLGLILAGAGQACYNTMQGSITLSHASPEMRGRAVGIISMGIGVLPVSLTLAGLAAQAFGPVAALTGTALLGMLLLGIWSARAPDLRSVA